MTSIRHNHEVIDPVEAEAPDARDTAYLDAAREAILAVGWSRTTLTDIARRAGVSRMTLYRRWPDTQTLLADLMTREWSTVVAGAAAGAGAQPDARARLRAGITATVAALREDALVRRIVEVDPEVLLPYLLQRRGRSQEHVATLTSALVAEGQREGSVRRGDPDVLARSLVLAAHGFVLSAQTMLEPGADVAAGLAAYDHELGELVDRFLRP